MTSLPSISRRAQVSPFLAMDVMAEAGTPNGARGEPTSCLSPSASRARRRREAVRLRQWPQRSGRRTAASPTPTRSACRRCAQRIARPLPRWAYGVALDAGLARRRHHRLVERLHPGVPRPCSTSATASPSPSRATLPIATSSNALGLVKRSRSRRPPTRAIALDPPRRSRPCTSDKPRSRACWS
jgi:hypothetical protein